MSDGINNLEKLTDQIYQEGIEKAEKQSKQMLQDAQDQKAMILKNAKAEAESIIEEAEREVKRLKLSTESELELKAKQFISDLKGKIQNLLSQKIIENKTKEALADVDFIKNSISEILKHWKNANDVELVLPQNLEDKFKGVFSKKIHEVAPNMVIKFDSNLNNGFRIARKDDNYQISFSDDDFIAIFKTYLSEQTHKILFDTSG